jgi:type II secretory pathway pseudopilin PulG
MRRADGFTLVEIIVAAVLLMTSVVSVMSAVGNIAGRPVKNAGESVGVQYARNFLNSLRSSDNHTGWNNLAGALAIAANKPIPAGFAANFPGCSGRYTVSSDVSGARRVVVTVSCP